jgi:hypothetical protein
MTKELLFFSSFSTRPSAHAQALGGSNNAHHNHFGRNSRSPLSSTSYAIASLPFW